MPLSRAAHFGTFLKYSARSWHSNH